MPPIFSYPKQTSEWEGVLLAAEELLPDLQAEKAELTETLTRVRFLKERQDSLFVERQETTRELRQALLDGQDLVAKVRDAARYKIGRRDERLAGLGITPLRERSTKGKEAPSAEPAKP